MLERVSTRGRAAELLIIYCLCLLAVFDQSERDQNEEGNRAVAASSRILPCANQVSVYIQYLDVMVFKNHTLLLATNTFQSTSDEQMRDNRDGQLHFLVLTFGVI